jgi:hypothetical protein
MPPIPSEDAILVDRCNMYISHPIQILMPPFLEAEGGSLDISDAPTLVEDLSTNTSSPEQTTDEELEITSRIDPRLLEDGLTKR